MMTFRTGNQQERAMPRTETARVLVVEDNSQFQETIKKYLIADGYEVDTAGDKSTAIQKIDCPLPCNPHVLLLDLVLPDPSGRESPEEGIAILRYVLNARHDLPVVIMSVLNDARIGKIVFSEGASGYVVKIGTEFDFTLLAGHVRAMLNQHPLE